jgi:FAD binding domain in molybdopterin dehydrogenase
MKASAFSYARATSVSDALQLLVTHGDKAKVLSGGQSLVPAMNLRLISPETIVDIGQIAELRGVTELEPQEDQQASASMRTCERRYRACLPGAGGADAECPATAVVAPFGVTITEIPLTPQLILTALGRI